MLFSKFRPGTYSWKTQGNDWVRLQTWKEGLLSRVGHDLLIDAKEVSVSLTISSEDESASLEVTIPKRELCVLEPADLKDKDKREIHKNIQKHLSGDLHFSGSLLWEKETQGRIQGSLRLGRGSAALDFPVQLHEEKLSGQVQFTHRALGIKPYKAPLGLIRMKEELDVSFQFDVGNILA